MKNPSPKPPSKSPRKSANSGRKSVIARSVATRQSQQIIPNPLGIYIHWPYCLSKCPYCDFFSETKPADQDLIISQYLADLDFYQTLTPDRVIASIFFGGGTPSLIKPNNLAKLIDHIHKKWKTNKDIEITLEANPNTLNTPPLLRGGWEGSANFFSDCRAAGITRLSLGVQALNDPDLQFLGRTHPLKQALQSIDEVIKTFDNHSMDLIYARPDQKLEDWQKELEQAANFGFKHLSLYQLTIEEGTPFHKKGIKALEDDRALELYQFTEQHLKKKGYHKYEVSNFARPGFESVHNLGYWQGRDYLGIGPSAHGRLTRPLNLPLDGEGGVAREAKLSGIATPVGVINKRDHRDPADQPSIFATTHPRLLEPLTPTERATELLLLGLRLASGIDKQAFQAHCSLELNTFINQPKLGDLKAQNLLTETKTHLKPTPQGFLVLDKIIEELI